MQYRTGFGEFIWVVFTFEKGLFAVWRGFDVDCHSDSKFINGIIKWEDTLALVGDMAKSVHNALLIENKALKTICYHWNAPNLQTLPCECAHRMPKTVIPRFTLPRCVLQKASLYRSYTTRYNYHRPHGKDLWPRRRSNPQMPAPQELKPSKL